MTITNITGQSLCSMGFPPISSVQISETDVGSLINNCSILRGTVDSQDCSKIAGVSADPCLFSRMVISVRRAMYRARDVAYHHIGM